MRKIFLILLVIINTHIVLAFDSSKAEFDKDLDKILAVLKDKNYDRGKRLELMLMIGLAKINDERVESALEELSEEDNEYIRAGVTTTIGSIWGKASIPILKEALHDKSAKVKLSAAYSLGVLGDDSGYDLARDLMKDSDAITRKYAVMALGTIGKAESEPLIDEVLEDKDLEIRIEAKKAKKEIGLRREENKIKYLKEVLENDSEPEVQFWAAWKLREKGEEGISVLKEINADKNNKGSEMAGQILR